jgi:acetamidase/formamidase
MSKHARPSVDHQTAPQIRPDAKLCSTPDTVLWGYIAANLPPALSIKPGQTVEIEALSHQGLTTHQDPVRFFGAHGIAAQEVLSDAKVVFAEVKRPKGASVHILTGPIYIEGAEPGDTLEIRVLDIQFRVPYGVNNTEVDGGAIEISLMPTLQFILHKHKTINLPRAETATDYLMTGLSVDLNEATKIALQEAVDFLQAEKGMSGADAYALSSLAVDLGIGEAVDVVNLVYAKIPKSIFRSNPDYWYTPSRELTRPV